MCQRVSMEVRACSLCECLFIRGAVWMSQRYAGRFLETKRVHTTTFCNAINFWGGGRGWAVLGLLIDYLGFLHGMTRTKGPSSWYSSPTSGRWEEF